MINDEDDFNAWNIPDLKDDSQGTKQVSSLLGNPAKWYTQDKKQSSPKKEAKKALTLDDVEEIRQSAYDDGFNEGNEAGFAQGLEKGTLEGIKQGTEQGFSTGEQQGLDEGKIRTDELARQWESLITRLHCPLEKLDDNVEYQLVNLATELAEQITRCEVEQNPKVILQALKQCVEALPVNEQKLTILLHPDDLSFVQQVYSKETCLERKWFLQAEPTLFRGDCQIHTQTSSIDYTFNARIKQILSQFFRQNFNTMPTKNNDSNLLNDEPMVVVPEDEPSTADAQTAESENITNKSNEETMLGEANLLTNEGMLATAEDEPSTADAQTAESENITNKANEETMLGEANLLTNEVMLATAEDEPSTDAAQTPESENTTNKSTEETMPGDANEQP